MALFSHLPIYCIINFSPNCPSACLKLILDFPITVEAAVNPRECTAPTTVFQSSSLIQFQVTILDLLFLCSERGNFITRMPVFYLNGTIFFFIYDRALMGATTMHAQLNQVLFIVGL